LRRPWLPRRSRRRAIGLGQDFLRPALPRFAQNLLGALRRLLEILLAALARGEPVRDLLLARLDRPHQRRPHEFRRKPDETPQR